MRHWYQIWIVCFLVIAGFLLIGYCFLSNNNQNSNEIIANIFLGVSTGLFSGIVLLTVTGRKSRDRGKLEERLKAVRIINNEIEEINHLADDIIHKTYKGKADNMYIGEYALVLEECIRGFAYNAPFFNSCMRRITESLELYKSNSDWFDKKNYKKLQDKVNQLGASIRGISDSYDNVDNFLNEFNICNSTVPSDPELEQIARADMNNISLMCRCLFHMPPQTEYRLEESIRTEIIGMDRSIF
ncbi:MAG: hypothetical protein IJT94_16995 [Oscillibacter sp.]|nr:hypothetical protein [Oscillibacter sp.]